MDGEKLLNHMGYMTSLFIADCLKNVNMDGIRHKDLRGFK
jgi:hypothetical protein